jgi:hypothetical protein
VHLIYTNKASIQTLSTYIGGAMLPIQVYETCPYLLQMVNMLGQATWIQNDFNSYLYDRVVINYQKERLKALFWFW